MFSNKINISFFTLASLIIIAQVLTYLYPWDAWMVPDVDFLDSYPSWITAMRISDTYFSGVYSRVPAYFGGISRNLLPTDLNLGNLIFYLFGTFKGYVITLVVSKFVAFVGMYFFVRDQFLKEDNFEKYIAILIALSFALLPFFPTTHFSIVICPLVFNSFLKILQGREVKTDYAILFVFPFTSQLVFTLNHIYLPFAAITLYFIAFSRGSIKKAIITLSVMSVINIFIEYRMFFQNFFVSDFVSQRTIYNLHYISMKSAISTSIHMFLKGLYHSYSNHELLIYSSAAIAPFVLFFQRPLRKSVLFLFLSLVIIAAIYGFYDWVYVTNVRSKISLLKVLNLRRFFYLYPFLWHASLAVVAIGLYRFGYVKNKILLLPLFAGSTLYFSPYLGATHDYWYYAIGVLAVLILGAWHFKLDTKYFFPALVSLFLVSAQGWSNFFHSPQINSLRRPVQDFFSERTFSEIREYIALPQNEYRVLAIGFHPGLATEGGFYALGGYLQNYDLKYGLKFQKIIEKELDRCPENERFSAKVPLKRLYAVTCTKDPALNIEVLRSMGGKYILSVREIENYKELDLKYHKKFQFRKDTKITNISLYGFEFNQDYIYLYEVNAQL